MSDESSYGSALAAHGNSLRAEVVTPGTPQRNPLVQCGKVFAAIASVAVSVSLAGCSSGGGQNDHSPSPRPTGRSSAVSPSPTDKTIIPTVSSVVPYVNAVLKKQGISLPLESDKSECHPGKSSHTGDTGNTGQTCRWHPNDAGPTGYRILSVDVEVENDPQMAHDNLSFIMHGVAPRAETLGNESISQGVQFTETAITVRGRDEGILSSGAEIVVRVHNVVIDVTWAGADYRAGSDGTLTHVTGLTREAAASKATTITKAIIAHIQ